MRNYCIELILSKKGFILATFFKCYLLSRFVYRLFFPDPRERITDPFGDVISFISEFEIKYPNHPTFYRVRSVTYLMFFQATSYVEQVVLKI